MCSAAWANRNVAVAVKRRHSRVADVLPIATTGSRTKICFQRDAFRSVQGLRTALTSGAWELQKKRKKEASRVPKSLSFARNDAYQIIVTIWFIADPDSAFKPSLTTSFEATTHTRTNRKKANRSIQGRPSISSRFSNGHIRTAPGRPQFRTTETNCRNRQLGTGDDPCSAAVAESALSSNLAVESCSGNNPFSRAASGESTPTKIRNV